MWARLKGYRVHMGHRPHMCVHGPQVYKVHCVYMGHRYTESMWVTDSQSAHVYTWVTEVQSIYAHVYTAHGYTVCTWVTGAQSTYVYAWVTINSIQCVYGSQVQGVYIMNMSHRHTMYMSHRCTEYTCVDMGTQNTYVSIHGSLAHGLYVCMGHHSWSIHVYA